MRLLVTGGAGFIGSHYVRTRARRRLGATAPDRARGARQAHLRRQPGEPRRRCRGPAAHFVEGDILDRAARRPADGRGRRRRALRRREPRRPLDPRRRRLRDDQRRRHPDPAGLGAASGHREVRARLDRRGLRLDRRGQLGRGAAARAQLAVLRLEGLQRPARPRLPPHPRAAGAASRDAPTTTARTSSPRRSSRCSSPT